jgi:hypothetical protein
MLRPRQSRTWCGFNHGRVPSPPLPFAMRHEHRGRIDKRYGRRKIRMAGHPASTLSLYPSVPRGLEGTGM